MLVNCYEQINEWMNEMKLIGQKKLRFGFVCIHKWSVLQYVCKYSFGASCDDVWSQWSSDRSHLCVCMSAHKVHKWTHPLSQLILEAFNRTALEQLSQTAAPLQCSWCYFLILLDQRTAHASSELPDSIISFDKRCCRCGFQPVDYVIISLVESRQTTVKLR